MGETGGVNQDRTNDLKTVLDTVQGRRFMWQIMGEAGIFAPCFTPEAEGARRFGLQLFGEIMAEAPEKFLTMQREAIEYEQQRKAAENHSGSGSSDDYRCSD